MIEAIINNLATNLIMPLLLESLLNLTEYPEHMRGTSADLWQRYLPSGFVDQYRALGGKYAVFGSPEEISYQSIGEQIISEAAKLQSFVERLQNWAPSPEMDEFVNCLRTSNKPDFYSEPYSRTIQAPFLVDRIQAGLGELFLLQEGIVFHYHGPFPGTRKDLVDLQRTYFKKQFLRRDNFRRIVYPGISGFDVP